MNARERLRRDLRRVRRSLPPDAREAAALAIAHHLLGLFLTTRFRHIAGYVAVRGEVDPGPFAAAARERGRAVYLPVLERRGTLRFVRAAAGAPLAPNRFGIPEPVDGERLPARRLDLVLVPLVAVDDAGNRIGMGAGYYDRTFRFLRGRTGWMKPRLVGVGYDFQRVPRIEPAPWDVPLSAVVTEAGITEFR